MPARERGTTLLLFPAGILVVMILAAIAVDLAMLSGARRTLIREVGAAADDAALQLDLDQVRDGTLDQLDVAAARRSVETDIALAELPGDAVGTPIVQLGPTPGTIVVEVTRDIPHVFAKAIPGAPESERVTVRLSGRLIDPGE